MITRYLAKSTQNNKPDISYRYFISGVFCDRIETVLYIVVILITWHLLVIIQNFHDRLKNKQNY